MVNLPADTTGLKGDAGAVGGANLPKGAANLSTDFDAAGWGGMCPPEGDKAHRYIFTVHALKTDKLDIPAHTTAALAGFVVNANTIAKASFTAKYGRAKTKK